MRRITINGHTHPRTQDAKVGAPPPVSFFAFLAFPSLHTHHSHKAHASVHPHTLHSACKASTRQPPSKLPAHPLATVPSDTPSHPPDALCHLVVGISKTGPARPAHPLSQIPQPTAPPAFLPPPNRELTLTRWIIVGHINSKAPHPTSWHRPHSPCKASRYIQPWTPHHTSLLVLTDSSTGHPPNHTHAPPSYQYNSANPPGDVLRSPTRVAAVITLRASSPHLPP